MMAFGKGMSVFAVLSMAAAANCTASPPAKSAAAEQVAAAAAAPVSSVAAEAEPGEVSRSAFWLASEPVQGAVILGRAPTGATNIRFDGKLVAAAPDGFFLLGFDRDAPATLMLTADLTGGGKVTKELMVAGGDWRLEYINAPYRGGAKSSEEFQRRRGAELAQIAAARTQSNDSDGWRQEFIWPVQGRLSGLFGAQRIYQGKPGTYHGGMDIAAANGTPFVAPADGVVILAAESPFTLEGNLLMIDHGMGLNSAFLHCSELLVKNGDVVKQGQVIGKVGVTGRATGPHLHWGMKWNDARVDPKLILPAR
ncbi:M23 family metallopeptidase [Sphingorhabdus arenilitoris]|uniref:M23 family metallopeptidase n=1 Tax=Sphingorhabdus arenilitoris TaxID=1490041 RepID=A0ABV8RDC4_9SPHN